MPEPTSSQKRTMGIYIIILFLVILGFWAYFMKIEFRQTKTKTEYQNQDLSSILDQLKHSLKEGRELWQEFGQSWRPTSTPEEVSSGGLTEEQQERLINKVRERLNNSE